MDMTRRQLLLFILGAAPALAKGVLDWHRENLLIADQLERSQASARLFLLKPHWEESERQLKAHPKGYFRRYPIRSQAALGRNDSVRLFKALSQSLQRYSSSDGRSTGFAPGYALRLERKGAVEAELLVSFESTQLYYFGPGRPLHGQLRGGADVFQAVAAAHGLR